VHVQDPQNPPTASAAAFPPPRTAERPFTPQQLDAISGWTRALNVCMVGVILLVVFLLPTDYGLVAVVAAALLQFIPTLGLTSVMRMRSALLWSILALIPYLGLIPLLIVSRKSTALLRRSGYRVGFLGARRH